MKRKAFILGTLQLVLKQSSLSQESETQARFQGWLAEQPDPGSQKPGSALPHHAGNGRWVVCLPWALPLQMPQNIHPSPALVQWRRASEDQIRDQSCSSNHWNMQPGTENKPAATHIGHPAWAAGPGGSNHLCRQSCCSGPNSIQRQQAEAQCVPPFLFPTKPVSDDLSHTGTKITQTKKESTNQSHLTSFLCRKG